MTFVAFALQKLLPSLTNSASTTSPATAPATKTVLPSSVCAMASGPYVILSTVSCIRFSCFVVCLSYFGTARRTLLQQSN